jgi:hypothetical protein
MITPEIILRTAIIFVYLSVGCLFAKRTWVLGINELSIKDKEKINLFDAGIFCLFLLATWPLWVVVILLGKTIVLCGKFLMKGEKEDAGSN